MKSLLCLFLFIFFLTVTCSAQDSGAYIFNINSLPSKGVILDKGWKFTVGDNAAYASPDYDDSKWQAINPAKDIYYLPQIRNAGICWLRLTLNIDTAALNKPLAFVINQVGASEVYLNGRLLQRLGKVSKEPKQLETFNPRDKPITFKFTGGVQQVFAVRYAFSKRFPLVKSISNETMCFRMAIQMPDKALENYVTPLIVATVPLVFQFGIYLFLCVIHLFFYLSYPSRKVNLYFAIYTFGESMTFWGGPNNLFFHQATTLFIGQVLFIIFASVANAFKLVSVSKFFNQPNDIILKFIIVLCVLGIPLGLWPYKSGGITPIIGFIAVGLATIRISILATKRKQPGGKTVLIGQLISTLSFISFVVIALFVYTSDTPFLILIIYQVLFTLSFLCPPIFISLLPAREFAQTNRSLKLQLDEVEKLSQKTIIQEQEKQQFLAQQNETLEKEVVQRTSELTQFLKDLKSTQSQLIQSEKMASLGELTAGIAHEIQNPLNFVNNFSEVNKELIEELEEEVDKGNLEEIKAIAIDIKENEQKINHHGKRADAIVKGMLQHSRASTGKKEPTDINALADEYLRLSYHGMRAKDKSFNATIETHFDESIGKIEVIPQDIGRVLLNLFNNAFYAVTEKKKAPTLKGENYEPTVLVTSKRISSPSGAGGIEISVKDNGVGIPQKAVDKIFQPFFTTKPTGQGTGLGLSLSYDIIKAHGGELNVETKEGEFAEFIIWLSLKENLNKL